MSLASMTEGCWRPYNELDAWFNPAEHLQLDREAFPPMGKKEMSYVNRSFYEFGKDSKSLMLSIAGF